MATIAKGGTLLTVVNVFTVSPDKQADLLVLATDETMRYLPGFISARIHRSLDGAKVINYAQCRSQAEFSAMQTNPSVRPHMQAAALARFEPIVCDVVDSISAEA